MTKSNFVFYFFSLYKEKKNLIFLDLFVKQFFKYSQNFFIFNSFFKKKYLIKLFNLYNFNLIYFSNFFINFNFILLLLLEFYFFKKKLKNLILKFIILEFDFFKILINQKKFFFFNISNISFFLDEYKIANFFFNLYHKCKKKDKQKQLVVPSVKEPKQKKFKSYLSNIQLPRPLKGDYYFNLSFDRFLKEYKENKHVIKKKKRPTSNYLKRKQKSNLPQQSGVISEHSVKTQIIKKQDFNLVKTRKLSSSSGSDKKPAESDSFIFFFFSKLVTQNIKNGKKKKSYKIFKDCLQIARSELGLDLSFKSILTKIFFNLNPFFVLKKYTLGRKIIIIPLPVTNKNIVNVNSRLFLRALKKRTELSFRRRLVEEIKDFYNGKMPMSIKLRNERILLAIENKDNIRYLRFFK